MRLSDCNLRVTAINGGLCLPDQWRTVGDRNLSCWSTFWCVCVTLSQCIRTEELPRRHSSDRLEEMKDDWPLSPITSRNCIYTQVWRYIYTQRLIFSFKEKFLSFKTKCIDQMFCTGVFLWNVCFKRIKSHHASIRLHVRAYTHCPNLKYPELAHLTVLVHAEE